VLRRTIGIFQHQFEEFFRPARYCWLTPVAQTL
jgi:hypothetical protein